MTIAQTKETLSLTDAASMLGKTRKTIRAWLDSGRLGGEKVTANNKNGYVWRVNKDSVLRVGAGLAEKKEKKAARVVPGEAYKEPETPDEFSSSEGGTLKDIKIDRANAERILKAEQAMKLQREREKAEGDLVSLENLAEDIERFTSGILPAIKEEVDVFFVQHSKKPVSSALSVALQKKLMLRLKKHFHKVKDLTCKG